MLSATDFLPLFITMLMKRAISWLPCLGSGRTRRAGWEPLRDMFGVRDFSRTPCPPEKRPPWPHVCFPQAFLPAMEAAFRAAPPPGGADYFFGRLAPYLERDWRRLVTPAQSRLPRTVW